MSEDRRSKIDHDSPPFSRLFVVCSRNHDEDDIRESFSKYGRLQDIWVVKDRHSGERKGIAYIKFEKASEAHIAMEKLHGSTIGSDPKPLKVLLSDNKGQSRSGPGETKPRSRIFILVPKDAAQSEIEEEFSKFGKVENVQILMDRQTGASKGCAYVTFEKPSCAFIALEDCDEKFRAVIAEPRVPRDARQDNNDRHSHRDGHGGGSYSLNHSSSKGGYADAGNGYGAASTGYTNYAPVYQTGYETISYTDLTDPGSMQRLYIVCHTSLYEEQLYSLFDLVPGLDTFELKHYRGTQESRGFAYATYRTVELACYAKRKLDGLEYPPGHKLIVKYAEERPGGNRDRQTSQDTTSAGGDWGTVVPDPSARLAPDPRARVSFVSPAPPPPPAGPSLLPHPAQAVSVSSSSGQQPTCPYTDISLPAVQGLAAQGTPCRAKLFIVGTPSLPEEQVLNDVFCRFSSLIDIKLLPGTSYGYIRFGMPESAEAAVMVMNNGTIQGNVIKLSQQEEPGSENKRARPSF